jgi:molybdopterin molybdotransferase
MLTGRRIDEALSWRTLRLASSLGTCGARETFHRARCVNGTAEILTFQDSSAQKALAKADLLVRQRADSPALEAGAEVEVLDF